MEIFLFRLLHNLALEFWLQRSDTPVNAVSHLMICKVNVICSQCVLVFSQLSVIEKQISECKPNPLSVILFFKSGTGMKALNKVFSLLFFRETRLELYIWWLYV